MQPFSGLLIVNPAFAGFEKNTSFHSGNQHYIVSKDQTYNLFYTTYDTYSEKLKGGIGLTFQHGLIANQNITLSKLGVSYAGFEIKTNTARIIPSFSTEISLATKQWFTYFIDNIFNSREEQPSLPGKQFTRYFIVKPVVGFLWDSRTITWGLSAGFPLRYSLSDDTAEGIQNEEQIPLSLSFYFTKKIEGKFKGLESSPFKVYPEIILFYNKAYLLNRVSLNMEQVTKIYGIFIQNDITNNMHCVGGTFGYRKNRFRIRLSTGIGIPGISENMGVTGELSLNIIIPPVHYSKINPWAPKRKLD